MSSIVRLREAYCRGCVQSTWRGPGLDSRGNCGASLSVKDARICLFLEPLLRGSAAPETKNRGRAGTSALTVSIRFYEPPFEIRQAPSNFLTKIRRLQTTFLRGARKQQTQHHSTYHHRTYRLIQSFLPRPEISIDISSPPTLRTQSLATRPPSQLPPIHF